MNEFIKYNIHQSWNPIFEKYKDLIFDNLNYFEEFNLHTIYLPKEQIFKVFSMNINDIKVVLLGQYPHHVKNKHMV